MGLGWAGTSEILSSPLVSSVTWRGFLAESARPTGPSLRTLTAALLPPKGTFWWPRPTFPSTTLEFPQVCLWSSESRPNSLRPRMLLAALALFKSLLPVLEPVSFPESLRGKMSLFCLGNQTSQWVPVGQSHQIYHNPTPVFFGVWNDSVLIQSSINNVLELRFGLFTYFFLLQFSFLPEGTMRPACPSLEPQTLKKIAPFSMALALLLQRNNLPQRWIWVSTSSKPIWMERLSCFCSSHWCFKGLSTKVGSECGSESSFLVTQQWVRASPKHRA